MAILRQPSPAAKYSLIYVTVGSLAMVWTGIWYYYMHHNEQNDDNKMFWCVGFFLSGLALFVIGLMLGRLGREAQRADVPVGEVSAVATVPNGTDKNAANGATPQAPMMMPQGGMAVAPGMMMPAPVAQPVIPPQGNPGVGS